MRAEKATGTISGKFGTIVAQIIAQQQFDRDAFNYFLDSMSPFVVALTKSR